MKAQVVSLPIYGSALIYGIHMIAHFREIKNAYYGIFCGPPISIYALNKAKTCCSQWVNTNQPRSQSFKKIAFGKQTKITWCS